MKRHLQITIDANRVTCGKCEHRSQPIAGGNCYCPAFYGAWLPPYRDTYRRCAPCLAAEKETQ